MRKLPCYSEMTCNKEYVFRNLIKKTFGTIRVVLTINVSILTKKTAVHCNNISTNCDVIL